MKRYNSISTYTITANGGSYRVSLERLTNTAAGAPRFRAIIDNGSDISAVYTFKGHYCAEKEEAAFILNAHLNH